MILFHGTNSLHDIFEKGFLGYTNKEWTKKCLKKSEDKEHKKLCLHSLKKFEKDTIFGEKVIIHFTSKFDIAKSYGAYVIAVEFKDVDSTWCFENTDIINIVHDKKIPVDKIVYSCRHSEYPKSILYLDHEEIDNKIDECEDSSFGTCPIRGLI